MTKIQTMTRTDRNIKMQAIMITSRSPEAIPEKNYYKYYTTWKNWLRPGEQAALQKNRQLAIRHGYWPNEAQAYTDKKGGMKRKTGSGKSRQNTQGVGGEDFFGAALKKLCHQTFCLGHAVFHSMSIRQLSRNNPFINSVRGERKIKCVCLEVLALVKYWLAFFSSGPPPPPRTPVQPHVLAEHWIETSARRQHTRTGQLFHLFYSPTTLHTQNVRPTNTQRRRSFDKVFTRARAHRHTNTQAV